MTNTKFKVTKYDESTHGIDGELSHDVNDVDDLDMDYLAEEAAKETLLKNEFHESSFSENLKYGLTLEIMWENTPIWKEFWKEWKEKEITLRNHITDVKPLCKLPKNNKILVDCNSTSSSIFTCVDAEKGTISKCNNSRNALFSVPLCLEQSSKKIVACGKISTAYLCVPNFTNTSNTNVKLKLSPIKPCHDEKRQICLKKDGYLDLCQRIDNSTDLAITAGTDLKQKVKDSGMYIKYNNLTEWWKEWNFYTDSSNTTEVLKNLSRLCQTEDYNDILVECKMSSNLSEVCIEARSGIIKQCSSIKKKDMPINICIQGPLNKISTCKEYGVAFICYFKFRNINSLAPCKEKHRQVCLINGSVNLCNTENNTDTNSYDDHIPNFLKSKKLHKNTTIPYDLYKGLFQVKNKISRSKELPSDEEIIIKERDEPTMEITEWNDREKQIRICRSKTDRNRVVICNSSLAYTPLCVSAKRNTIGNCNSYNTTDTPMPVCVEEVSKKIVICDNKFPVVYLCFNNIRPEKRSRYFVFPCTRESDMRCLNDKSKLGRCDDKNQISIKEDEKLYSENKFRRSLQSSVKTNHIPQLFKSQKKIFKNKDVKAMNLQPQWLNVSSYTDRFQNLTKEKEIALCKFNATGDYLFPCEERYTEKQACISLKLGVIDYCENLNEQESSMPICLEIWSNKLKICETYQTTYLCFQNIFHNLNSEFHIIKCYNGGHHICLDKQEGILYYCSALKRSTREATEEHGPEEQFWINYWMEWAHPHVEHFVKDPDLSIKLLCLAENNNLIECFGKNIGVRACVSANQSYVARCNELTDFEKAVPICMERRSNKIITCGKFPRAYLCYPPSGHLKPKLPCHDESRHVCYEDGLIQNCLIANFYKAKRQNHKIIKKSAENRNDTINTNNSSLSLQNLFSEEKKDDAEVTSKELIFLCEMNNTKYVECNKNASERDICINLALQKIEVCDKNENTSSIRVCKEVATNRIITCESKVPSYVCIDDNETYSLKNVCDSSNHYVCLTENGSLINCMNLTQNATISQHESESDLQKQIRNMEGTSLQLLCSAGDDRFTQCIDDPYILITCISTSTWTLLSCEEAEEKSEIALPVCVQSNTSRLMTCDTFSQGTLCYSTSNGSSTFMPCETNTRIACVDNEGIIRECTQFFNETSSSKRMEVMKHKWILERTFKGLEPMCFLEGNNELKSCLGNGTHNAVCLHSKIETIGPCNETKPYLMSIPICRDIDTDELITCGKFNKVNICEHPNKLFHYSSCSSEKQNICFDEGKIRKCDIKMSISRKDRAVDSFIRNNHLDIQNDQSTHVYKFERLERMLQGTKPLCMEGIHLISCGEGSATNLACYGVESGKIQTCASFDKTEDVLILHLEVKSKIITASKKVFTTNLCISEKSGKIHICSEMNNFACLNNTFITKCKKSVSGVNQIQKNIIIQANQNTESGENFMKDFTKYKDFWDKNFKYIEYKENNVRLYTDNIRIKRQDSYSESDNIDKFLANFREECDEEQYRNRKKETDVKDFIGRYKDQSHGNMSLLCSQNSESNETYLEICESKRNYACFAINSRKIKLCEEFEFENTKDVILPVCTPDFYKLFACDVMKQLQLCISEEAGENLAICDSNASLEACLAPDKTIIACEDFDEYYNEEENVGIDEKFMRLSCNNCTIENTLVVVGTPESVLPEAEVITFEP